MSNPYASPSNPFGLRIPEPYPTGSVQEGPYTVNYGAGQQIGPYTVTTGPGQQEGPYAIDYGTAPDGSRVPILLNPQNPADAGGMAVMLTIASAVFAGVAVLVGLRLFKVI